MTPDVALKTINARWVAQWPTLSAMLTGAPIGGVPYSLDNMTKPDATPYFARLKIVDVDSQQYTMGTTVKVQHLAILDVRLEGPLGVGAADVLQLAGYVATIFSLQRFGGSPGDDGIVCHATRRVSIDDDNSWILACRTPVEYYELRQRS